MNPSTSIPTRHRLLSGILLVVMSGGCSALYDLNTKQCSTTEDCRNMGPQFELSECRYEVCVLKAGKGGSTGAGGQGGTTARGGSSSVGGSIELGGTPSYGGIAGTVSGGGSVATGGIPATGGTPDVGGAAGASGSPGTGGQPTCSNVQCQTEKGSPNWICRKNSCVNITSDDCPVVIPKKSAATLLEQQDVIVLGGFASMNNPSNLFDSQAIVNWDLAFDEFNKATLGGLPSITGGGQRPFVGVICSTSGVTTEIIQRTVHHLAQEVEVPAILSTLSANFLYQAWSYLHPTDPTPNSTPDTTFFMSTGSADMRLANLADGGLMWHMLGDPRVLAAPLVALVKQIEPLVNAKRAENFLVTGQDDPANVPLRVTLISSDDPTMTDIAGILVAPESATRPGTTLTFNAKSAIENGSNFNWRKIQTTDVSPAIQEIGERPPHVIIALTTAEFSTNVVPAIEPNWPTLAPGRIRPFYVMSHRLYNTPELKANALKYSTSAEPFSNRVVGINYASAQDPHAKELYSQYLSQLKSTYQGSLTLDGTENHYDGAYYLLYSLAAAAATLSSPTGEDIYYGLKTRIISENPSAAPVDVGYGVLSGRDTAMGTITRLFSDRTNYKMSLYGTLGPPDFDRFSGTRVSATSAWCIEKTGTAVWNYKADGLIFDPAKLSYSPPSAGIATCLQNYCQQLSTETKPTCLVK